MPRKRQFAVLASAALLSPLPLAVGSSSAVAAGFCDGYAHATTRTIYQQGQSDTPWSYVWNPNPGTYSVCLDGPKGRDFNLAIQRWDAALAQWVTVAAAERPGPDETLSYTDTQGSTALYGIIVTAVRGSGDYTLAFNHTPSS